MTARLSITEGLPSKSAHDLKRLGSFTLGRRSQCDLFLPDKSVSRKHCRIDYDGETYWLIDSGSHNGTYVNGERVTHYMLHDGDHIKVGRVELGFSNPETADDD